MKVQSATGKTAQELQKLKKMIPATDGQLDRLPQTLAALTRGIEQGLHTGAQVYVSRGGSAVADFAIGFARPGVPMRRDSLTAWMSAGKPLAAVAVAQLWEQALLDLDDPVARHVPEFAARGKDAVTIRHLLTHTGGFRALVGKWEAQPWDSILAAVCDMRLEPGWVPGRKAGYHLATSWYVLGEIVRRLDPAGRDYGRYVREMIGEPLGMEDSWVGMPEEVYRGYGDRIAVVNETAADAKPQAANSVSIVTSTRPGSGARGPVRELGFFYEMLLGKGELSGVRILSPQAVEALVAGHRIGMYDHTFRHVMDWGLGFILNSARYGADTVPYGYGPHASPRTFGHGGSQCCTGFADPEKQLAVAIAWNGRPGEAAHDRRLRETLAAVYEDLGPASQPAA
jgi:CubicO group peptidase (beta-lactamase class C family)